MKFFSFFLCGLIFIAAQATEQSFLQELKSAFAEKLYITLITADFSYQTKTIFDEESSFIRLKGQPLPEEFQELIRNIAQETGYWGAEKLQIYFMNLPSLEMDNKAFNKGFIASMTTHEICINPLIVAYYNPDLICDLFAEFFTLRTYAGPITQYCIALGSALCSYIIHQKIAQACSTYTENQSPSWLTSLAQYTQAATGFCGTIYLTCIALRTTVTAAKDTYVYKRFIRNYFFENGHKPDFYKAYLTTYFEQTGDAEYARKLEYISEIEAEYITKALSMESL